ncbi:MAG TPA: site-specific integrase, partial [Nitrososphaera sp.]|nr:site-specific integrase [Nitrososphaera sp.]
MERLALALESSPAWIRFTKSLKSPFTRRYYEGDLKRFMRAAHVSEPEELLRMKKSVLQDRIVNYVIARQENEGIRAQSITKELSALRHFFQHNDRTDINWTIVKGYVKEPIKAVRDRAYTVEEIQKMLQYADYRTRVVILLMCSSGMRLGAIPELRVRHLQEVKGQPIYAITVYERTHDEYTTYCSPECKAAIDGYFDYRRRAGEIINPESPLLREQFDGSDKFKVLNPQVLGRETVSSLIKIVAYKAGLRKKSTNRFERKETMLNHGMRKLFFRACGKAK